MNIEWSMKKLLAIDNFLRYFVAIPREIFKTKNHKKDIEHALKNKCDNKRQLDLYKFQGQEYISLGNNSLSIVQENAKKQGLV